MSALAEARPTSPLGSSSVDAAERRARRSPQYRAVGRELTPYRAIAEVVILGRAARGWTQRQLADAIGTTNTVVSRIESGRHAVSLDTLVRLSRVLSVTFTISAETDDESCPEVMTTQLTSDTPAEGS